MEEAKEYKIVSVNKLLAMEIPKREPAEATYLQQTGKLEEVYCSYCDVVVTKAIKEYRGGNGKQYAEARAVCSGGCNTDWAEVVWHYLNNKSRR